MIAPDNSCLVSQLVNALIFSAFMTLTPVKFYINRLYHFHHDESFLVTK